MKLVFRICVGLGAIPLALLLFGVLVLVLSRLTALSQAFLLALDDPASPALAVAAIAAAVFAIGALGIRTEVRKC